MLRAPTCLWHRPPVRLAGLPHRPLSLASPLSRHNSPNESPEHRQHEKPPLRADDLPSQKLAVPHLEGNVRLRRWKPLGPKWPRAPRSRLEQRSGRRGSTPSNWEKSLISHLEDEAPLARGSIVDSNHEKSAGSRVENALSSHKETPISSHEHQSSALETDPKKQGLGSEPSRRVALAGRMEIPWLKDPAKLANRVSDLLELGDAELALHITRLASKERDLCVVAWNHLIDYYLRKQRQGPKVAFALKLFNEMKKRAQSPDAYTFSLLLRGLSIHSEPEIALPKALALYQSMCDPDARIPPREIHTNYLLRICSRAGDMKSLWQALHQMPESGPGAPSTTTYTILLHALTVHASSPKATLEWVTETVETGRQIWGDVVKQWEKGNLTMDAKFVFSMASLLLKSPRAQDWDAVFSLVEQTTGINRLIPRPGSASRRSFLRHGVAPDLRTREGVWKIRPESVELFRKLDSKIVRLAPASQQLLTAILTACWKLGEKAAATRYWKTISNLQAGGLLPDLESTKSYLRILRQSKASAAVTEVVREFTKREKADWGLFRIAMSTCTRNFKSGPKVFDEATELYDLRKEKMTEVDLTFLDRYLSVIHATIITTPGSTDLKSEAGQRHLNALLAVANDAAMIIRSGSSGWSMDDGNARAKRWKKPSGSFTREETNERRSNGFGKQADADERTAELAKRILGLFDKLVNSGAIQPSVVAALKRTFSDYVRQSEHGDPFLRRRDDGT